MNTNNIHTTRVTIPPVRRETGTASFERVCDPVTKEAYTIVLKNIRNVHRVLFPVDGDGSELENPDDLDSELCVGLVAKTKLGEGGLNGRLKLRRLCGKNEDTGCPELFEGHVRLRFRQKDGDKDESFKFWAIQQRS